MTKKNAKSKKPAPDMRHVANVLLCPHEWSEAKETRVRHSDSKRKPYLAMVSICKRCGTNRLDHDGISSLYPPQPGQQVPA